MKKGFTLLELLIVVSLIAILSGVILQVLNVSGIRSKSKDAQRVSDLEKMQVALELYFTDNNLYPTAASWINLGNSSLFDSTLVGGGYINSIPHDPEETVSNADPCSNPESNRYNYRTTASGSAYILTAIMDTSSSNDVAPCHDLNNWGAVISACGGGYATSDVCYGVENP